MIDKTIYTEKIYTNVLDRSRCNLSLIISFLEKVIIPSKILQLMHNNKYSSEGITTMGSPVEISNVSFSYDYDTKSKKFLVALEIPTTYIFFPVVNGCGLGVAIIGEGKSIRVALNDVLTMLKKYQTERIKNAP